MSSIRLYRYGLVVLLMLMCGVAEEALAGIGSLSGRVTDTAGTPIAFANVVVVGTASGAMTDQLGNFMIPSIPSGEHTILIAMMGYPRVERHGVLVKSGWSRSVDFQLERVPTPPADTVVPLWRPESRRNNDLDKRTSAQRDSIVDEIAKRNGVVITDPPGVRLNGVEFYVRYFAESEGDSTVVRVVCERKNVSHDTISEPGAVSFSERRYDIAPEVVATCIPVEGKWRCPIPILEGLDMKNTNPAFGHERGPLAPGDTIADTLRFSYETERFRRYPGKLHLQCLFATSGGNGEPMGRPLVRLSVPIK